MTHHQILAAAPTLSPRDGWEWKQWGKVGAWWTWGTGGQGEPGGVGEKAEPRFSAVGA